MISFLNIKFLNKKIFLTIFVLIILFLAVHLRTYNLTKFYTEYDDIFVLALHKGAIEDKEISVNIGSFKKSFTLKLETILNLEKSYLYPFHIAYSSTYSPGQYFFLPFFLSDKDSYDTKVFKARLLSSFASIFTLFILLYILFKLNRQFEWSTIFVLSIFAFSQNSILYAHHMGVYSTYCLATSVGLYLTYLLIEKKISIYKAVFLNTFLLYFSYLNIFFFIPLIYIEYKKKNLKNLIVSYFTNKKILLLFNIFLFLPFFLLFALKGKTSYSRGVESNEIESLLSFYYLLINLAKQFFVATKFLFIGFIPNNFSTIFTIFFILIFISLIIYLIKSNQDSKKILTISCLLYFLQWMLLYVSNVIPLDQTRHSLTFFPILVVVLFILFSSFKVPNLIYVIILVILIPYSYMDAKKTINKKTSVFDLNFLEKQKEKDIYLYGPTLSPLLYFENGKKNVFFTELKSFKKNFNSMQIPNQFLMVGQWKSLYDQEQYEELEKNFPKLFSEYNIEILKEKITGENFTYNNHPGNSPPNNFFVYKFIKK